jgi:hypothetical protein
MEFTLYQASPDARSPVPHNATVAQATAPVAYVGSRLNMETAASAERSLSGLARAPKVGAALAKRETVAFNIM